MGNQKPFCIPEYWDVRGTSLSSSYARQRFLSQQTMRVRHVSHVRTTKRTWTGSRKGRRHIDATVITQGSVVFLLEHLWPWHSLIPFLDLGPLDAAGWGCKVRPNKVHHAACNCACALSPARALAAATPSQSKSLKKRPHFNVIW